MSKSKSRLKLAQEQAEKYVNKTNEKIVELGGKTKLIYDKLNTLQQLFDAIRSIPNERRLEYEGIKKIRLSWKQQAEKIESDYRNAEAKNAGKGAAGVSAGIAVTALGPTAAMGIATTFGVASTGTAISSLSGAAATNAALAWLGGGALATGGGGIAAGNALLALAGPVGWVIAGAALVGSSFLFWKGKSDQNRLEDIFTLISERDIKSYKLAITEIDERIARITDESSKLTDAIERTKSFGLDYDLMTSAQQYELGAYVNLMNASTQLLVNPIKGLQPKYNEDDLKKYLSSHKKNFSEKKQQLIISLANLLYKIDMDDQDRHLLWKSFRANKKFLDSIKMSKEEFDFSVIETVSDVLEYKYCSENAGSS